MILIMPDGSSFDSKIVAAIRWMKGQPGDKYCPKARVVIDTFKSDSFSLVTNPPTASQAHYVEMESDEAAEKACKALVQGWSMASARVKTSV